MNLLDDENEQFVVLRNAENQYSLWPESKTVPQGWTVVHESDSKENCLRYVKENWLDLNAPDWSGSSG